MDHQVPPEIPAGLPSELLERRPDILQAEQFLVAQNARISYAIALRFPSISLTGLLGVVSDDLSNLTAGGAAWSVGGGLLGPVFNFGKNKRRVEFEKKRSEEAVLQYETVILQAFREVEDVLVEIETYRHEVEIKEAQLAIAQNAASFSNLRYDGGVTSYLEVLESQRTLFSIELDHSATRQAWLNAYVKLFNALGGGWTAHGETQTSQN
ncbi:MAG: TolC family protein [Bacteroidales bacterium]|nr:TolC family protein [Bacteroidales bacterium]